MTNEQKHAIKVGAIYDPRHTSWPEGAAWAHHDGWELLLRFPDPSDREIAAIERGPASLAILRAGPVALGLYRFGEGRTEAERAPLLTAISRTLGPGVDHTPADPIPWSDVPLTPHLWTRQPTNEERAPLRIVLIDANTGIVRALRLVLLAPGFTAAMREAASAARAAYTTPGAFEQAVEDLLSQGESADLAASAPNRTDLPAKTGEQRDA